MRAGFRVSRGHDFVIYVAYLDEFGHVGPYIGRSDPRHNTSPVFGFAGFIMPAEAVRGFGTWFFKRKAELFARPMTQSPKHPATWERKGSQLFRAAAVQSKRNVREIPGRMFREIDRLKGKVFYVGIQKTASPSEHRVHGLYSGMLREAIWRLDQFCGAEGGSQTRFFLALDEYSGRQELLTQVSRDMYGGQDPRRALIEPPFHLESHRYQTVQAADWIAALVGRLGAYWVEPAVWPENDVFERYYGDRLREVQVRSGIRRENTGEPGRCRAGNVWL